MAPQNICGLLDGENIESVAIFNGNRTTACISSQVGCQLGCKFCATGASGFVRDLSVSEIVGQFLAMEKRVGKDINNVVYMGMGEPLLNLDNVLKSIRILNSPKQRKLGIRHISISTSGIIPGIDALADFELPVRLSVSLHAPNDRIRSKLMPVNNMYPLSELMKALQNYQEKTGERITIEYIMINGVNDSEERAYELVSLLSGLDVYVNLIPYNPVTDKYERSPQKKVKDFFRILKKLEIEAEIRKEKGTDINAACGQLRRAFN
jgi:23S rRNA (adenine2503-C2)-methyltransferase